MKGLEGAMLAFRKDTSTLEKAQEAATRTADLQVKASKIFGSKQGGRIYAALGEPDVLNHILDELKNHSQGYAQRVGEERMAGFDGALSRLESSIKVAYTALGRAFDGGGSGGILTDATNGLARFVQVFAEAPPAVQRTVAAISAVGAAAGALKGFGLLKGGFGLNASAMALDRAAAHLMMVGGGPGGVGGGPGGAGGGPGAVLRNAGAAGVVGGEGAMTTEAYLAAAIPEIATAAAAAVAIVGVAAVTSLIRASAEAQKPGNGGQWAAPTPATEGLDRQRLQDQEDRARELRRQIVINKAAEKLPGTSDTINLPLQQELDQVDAQARLLRDRLGTLFVSSRRRSSATCIGATSPATRNSRSSGSAAP